MTAARSQNHSKRRIRHVTPTLIMKPEIRDLYVQVQGITFSIRVSKGEGVRLLEAAQSEGREITGDYLYNGPVPSRTRLKA